MLKAVFDANILVSAFLSRERPGGVSSELLRFVISGVIDLHLSIEIVDEAIEILLDSPRLRRRYAYSAEQVGQYRADLLTLAHTIHDPPAMPGVVARDPDDDKIVACAVTAAADYIVTRDLDLLDIGEYGTVAMIAPEQFIHLVRSQGHP